MGLAPPGATIFHITSREAWDRACGRGRYEAPSLATSGFIHCSKADQVVRVANRIFLGMQGLVLLHIDVEGLSAPVVYENLDGGSELFPHVYGPIELAAVRAVTPFEPGDDGRFDQHERYLMGTDP